jgi:endoglucanase
VLGGLYQQRSGIATEAPHTIHPRPAPHNPLLTPGFAGKLVYSSFRYNDFSEADAPVADKDAIDAAVLGPLDAWGWYQDAGDWDSYYSHTNVPMAMLALYEMAAPKFGDSQLKLPEAGNGLPDLLDEATWLPRFHQRLRAELLAKGYGTGGVGGGRVFGDLWGGDELPDGTTQGSWQDTARTWVCTGEDPFMTYKYAGLAAQTAFLLAQNGLTDPEGINWAEEAASAFNWAAQNTQPGDEMLFDLPLLHVRLFSAAQLYRLTGEAAYHQNLLDDLAALPNDFVFSEELLFGFFAYAQTQGQQTTDAAAMQTVRNRMKQEADFVMNSFRDTRACRWGGNFWMPMLIGQPTTPLVQAGILGHFLFKNSEPATAAQYLGGLYATADYFLGNNPLNMTWITGVGERSPKELFCIDGWYLDEDVPRQGIVPYGPWDASNWGGALGPWNHYWAFEFTHPAKAEWPGHEAWFEQRTCPLTNELTIHQTLGPSIFTYGYLYAQTAADFVSSTKESPASAQRISVFPNPTSSLLNVQHGLEGACRFTISNSMGVTLLSGSLANGQVGTDLLSPGLYLLRLENERGEWGSTKFIVSK